MNSIIQQITDWLKGLLVSGIMNNLTNTFSSVNDQVGQIATEVGQTPSSFLPAVFNMVRNLSETVIMPIAGILLTFIACYELIQLIISYNNLASFETWFIFKWIFKTYGINTSDYSFSYVAGWSEGKETPELKSSLDKIRQTAADFIYQIDQKLQVLQADREQGFIPVVPDSQEEVPNPDLKVAVDKALENLEKKRTQAKKKTSVKSRIKEKAEKSETTPKKTRTSKTKEERA